LRNNDGAPLKCELLDADTARMTDCVILLALVLVDRAIVWLARRVR
jgi:hypothetical protein